MDCVTMILRNNGFIGNIAAHMLACHGCTAATPAQASVKLPEDCVGHFLA